ncbi:hypothetical protein MASR2M17_18270 [Aminivibrio sp.]
MGPTKRPMKDAFSSVAEKEALAPVQNARVAGKGHISARGARYFRPSQ